jgi:hypothetical protein
MALTHVRRTWRAFRAPENSGFRSPLALAVLTAFFFVLGVVILPSSSQPAPIPDTPTLDVTFQDSPPPRQLFVYSFLMQTSSSQTQLVVEASGQFSPGQTEVGWTVGVDGFTGTNCTPKAQHASFISLGNDNYNLTAGSPIPPSGSPFFGINLCWRNNSPLAVSGAYVSADLPAIESTVSSGTATRGLELAGTSLSGYTLAGGLAQTKVTPESWIWTSTLSGSFQSPASASIPVIGSSISGMQGDNSHYLWAGIMFGVAGGAFVSIFPSVFDAIYRRKEAAAAAARSNSSSQEPGRKA